MENTKVSMDIRYDVVMTTMPKTWWNLIPSAW